MKQKVKNLQENIKKISRESFFRDFLVLIFLVVSAIFLLALFVIIFLGVKPSEVLIQLNYDNFSGVSKVGSYYKVYNLFIVGTVIFLVNTFLAYVLYEKEKLASVFLLVASLVTEVVLVMETINIIKLINF
ncbi:hypothetical protein COY62_03020 [bacterium (Candidatus Howlettbacteria) CG_4_10_14_0_8_um_filter_40_9]|nr:MAG: hypothetical protein COY62_03020 [bacterium (Candidatus Howlettbacteria) CG_4_10_14_0_8_um_filter_40_9]